MSILNSYYIKWAREWLAIAETCRQSPYQWKRFLVLYR